ncbi:histidine kinase dimerization/phospho-acceptor domain-containing protein [Nodosilinea sp. AN01ver1]|uniref:histidine kinase dimerization/phospho-acceptor domain-containing protein n=1 Tax=Nodosilinea sp. AN01ver1 TaxID=3423362 RepID=UPI003D31CA3F
MALPPLDYFLTPAPAYGLVTPLGEIAQGLGQPAGAVQGSSVAPSHIIVVDDEHRPLGTLTLGQLWACHHAQGRSSGASAELRVFDCQLWLEPVVEVSASQALDIPALSNLGRLVQGMPSRPLVVVDSDGQYLGVLNPVRLLGWLALEAKSSAPELRLAGASASGAGATESSTALPPESAQGAGGQRAWVLELSHALKTPMTTLLGLSTLLLDSRVGQLNERQFRYVSLIQQAIRKLTGLVNLLIDWMRLEAGQISLSLERVYLQPLADELVPSFLSAQPALKTAATWAEEFSVCLATAEGWVQADPLRLRQSLHYVLGYLIAHGAIPAGLLVEPWGNWLSFTLWSSTAIANPGPPLGAAMPAERRSRPDPQPDPESLEGLGLGLARRFSQLQGGELSGYSTPTWGSRITLLLPTRASSASETVLVLLASASETLVEQVYSSLRGSPYRLAVAPSCQTMAALQARLSPPCTLIHWESLADAPTTATGCLALVQRLAIAGVVSLRSARASPDDGPSSGQGFDSNLNPNQAAADSGATLPKTLFTETLAQGLRPTLDQICLTPPVSLASLKGLTMLLLRPGKAEGVLPPLVQTWLQRYHCRLLQVDDLQQANLLSRVWQPQAVILDGAMPVSIAYLQALARQPDLARLPLLAPVPPVDWAAAQALNLPLVACPEVLTQPLPQALVSLVQAIALAPPAPAD